MINDDTFAALGAIWGDREYAVFGAQNRHMDRMHGILNAVELGLMRQDRANQRAALSRVSFDTYCRQLHAHTAQRVSDELALWLF